VIEGEVADLLLAGDRIAGVVWPMAQRFAVPPLS
jgi:hypothetical protein